jgi:hypothetical protein
MLFDIKRRQIPMFRSPSSAASHLNPESLDHSLPHFSNFPSFPLLSGSPGDLQSTITMQITKASILLITILLFESTMASKSQGASPQKSQKSEQAQGTCFLPTTISTISTATSLVITLIPYMTTVTASYTSTILVPKEIATSVYAVGPVCYPSQAADASRASQKSKEASPSGGSKVRRSVCKDFMA